ncbi:hypothetical protein HRR83_000508 [Exophiala dermatitidis]|uniref:Protein kinase domain-containing protein n=1 Tax=Exophiala dermatitidis TaxID=5970 RepID=A0AAN6F527_EXODE|nr:hypothetical protein HRR75_000461 [Exophiala dermatitidis]KAJ4527754.1 hypothetical protein HRR74_000509 [Exophiala dermatitidis]KAJ4528390.1 hypothetical protein HRR73_001013 [Exophiala dermatitidis]KAJ4552758.1 hypothetical protein HRR78_003017 [Exophiala dermatitidis]KAJ4558506.1 hypothetical protein HRR77_000509 [Exophiala dermatitidis]
MGLEILECSEVWKEVDNSDDFEFSHTKVILRDGFEFFYARVDQRKTPSFQASVDPSALELHPIPTETIWPKSPKNALRCPNPASDSAEIYVKRPSLLAYGDSFVSTEIKTLVLHEVQICETLAQFQHPNIAKYLGCQVENDLITGLCFEKYGDSLFQMMQDGRSDSFDKGACLQDIRNGIQHLHSLEIVHGDINPHNILSHGDNFVIIDFDSCAKVGEELGLKLGTDGWTQESTTAEYSNDWYGFSKIEEFLHDQKSFDTSSCTA